MLCIFQLETKLNFDPNPDPKLSTDPDPNLKIISDPARSDPQHWLEKCKAGNGPPAAVHNLN
jgi:hypothetical protein